MRRTTDVVLNFNFAFIIMAVALVMAAATLPSVKASTTVYNTNYPSNPTSDYTFVASSFVKLRIQIPHTNLDVSVLVPVRASEISGPPMIVYKACFVTGIYDAKSIEIALLSESGQVQLTEAWSNTDDICTSLSTTHAYPLHSTNFSVYSLRGIVADVTFL
jgi:hypothetical protein